MMLTQGGYLLDASCRALGEAGSGGPPLLRNPQDRSHLDRRRVWHEKYRDPRRE